MSADLKLFVVAGEYSGDRLGGALLEDLAARTPLTVRGVGGPDMLAQGLEPVFDMSEFSVMGYADVLLALPRLFKRLADVVRAAMDFRPDAVVLIDNKVFSQMASARLRKAGYAGPILLYVAPSVWAWKTGRARKTAHLFDEVFGVLPFEPRVMAELGGSPTTYVGHPAERLIGTGGPQSDRGLVALLPGSRNGELRRHMPMFERVVTRLAGHEAVIGFVLPTLPHLKTRLEAETADWPARVDVVATPEERRGAFARSIAALASAGTVTLELAMMDVPMVGTYIPDWIQMQTYKRWNKPIALLPNAILGERSSPEIEPGNDMDERVTAALRELLDDPDVRARQKAGFAKVRDQIVNGIEGIGRVSAADRVLAHCGRQPLIEKAGP